MNATKQVGLRTSHTCQWILAIASKLKFLDVRVSTTNYVEMCRWETTCVCLHYPWPQHLLPTLPPSFTQQRTISDGIHQPLYNHTHDSVHKHVSEDAPDPRRPWKTCDQHRCLPSCCVVPRDYAKALTKCEPPTCCERAVRSTFVSRPRGVGLDLV